MEQTSEVDRLRWSYSRVECFKQCPYKFRLRYIDKLSTLPDQEPDNALYCGTALHVGMEKNAKEAVKNYYSNYYVITDANVNEAIKIEALVNKMKRVVPEGLHEVKIDSDDYIGFIDLLVPISEDTYAMYDYKYSNNMERYLESGQLSVYKRKFEELNPTKRIEKLCFVFAPKIRIRQKKTETIEMFRNRLKGELEKADVRVIEVPYSVEKVQESNSTIREISRTKNFKRNINRLCAWCEFKDYCMNHEDWMVYKKEGFRCRKSCGFTGNRFRVKLHSLAVLRIITFCLLTETLNTVQIPSS